MIYPNKPLYLLSLLGYIYYLTYYTLTTKYNIIYFSFREGCLFQSPAFEGLPCDMVPSILAFPQICKYSAAKILNLFSYTSYWQ